MRFENKTGNHYKFYEITVQPGPDDIYRIYTSWGPIGSALVKHKVIYEGDIAGAIKTYEKVKKTRIRNGYTQIDE